MTLLAHSESVALIRARLAAHHRLVDVDRLARCAVYAAELRGVCHALDDPRMPLCVRLLDEWIDANAWPRACALP